jgi:hypothetical protein
VECDAPVNNTTPSTAGSQSTTAGQTQNQTTAAQPRGRSTAQQQSQTTAQPQSQSTAQQQQTTAQTQQQSQPSPGQTGKHQTHRYILQKINVQFTLVSIRKGEHYITSMSECTVSTVCLIKIEQTFPCVPGTL